MALGIKTTKVRKKMGVSVEHVSARDYRSSGGPGTSDADLAPLGCLVLSRQSSTKLPLTFQEILFFLLKDLAVAEDPRDALD